MKETNRTDCLNTLKDIGWRYPGYSDRHHSETELKETAIKWLKSNSPFLNDCNGAVDEWIKHFFNLTDEEINGIPKSRII